MPIAAPVIKSLETNSDMVVRTSRDLHLHKINV